MIIKRLFNPFIAFFSFILNRKDFASTTEFDNPAKVSNQYERHLVPVHTT